MTSLDSPLMHALAVHDTLCPLTHLRELDLDGSHFTGQIPRWIGDCFPNLHERSTAPVPLFFTSLPSISVSYPRTLPFVS